jgi:hypothetical protein
MIMGLASDSVEWAQAQAAYWHWMAEDNEANGSAVNAQYFATWAETYATMAAGPVRLIVEVWDRAHVTVEKRYLLETRFTWPEAVRFAQVADTFDIRHYAVPDAVAFERLAERERQMPSAASASRRSCG